MNNNSKKKKKKKKKKNENNNHKKIYYYLINKILEFIFTFGHISLLFYKYVEYYNYYIIK